MLNIIIGGKVVEVPADVQNDAAATQRWHRQQLVEAKLPHRVFKNGDAVEYPAELAGKSQKDLDTWAADEEERRTDPAAFAEKQAAAAAEKVKKAPAAPTAAAPVPSSKE